MGLPGSIRIAVSALIMSCCAVSVHAADAALIAAARKEGHVVWYTTLIINQFARPAAEAFEKKYGIKVDYVRADPTAIALRLVNESKAGQVQADIFDGFGVSALVKEGYVESWLPEAIKHYPRELYDPKGHWVASNLYVLTPAFNTSLVPKGSEPKTFADLLDPKWKGRMAWSSRGSASSAPGFIGSVLTAMGEEKGMDYLKKLAGQNIVSIDASARQIVDQMIAGEYAIALQTFNHHSVISAAKGAPSAWIPMEPAMTTLNVVALTSKSPHPSAGKLFMEFLVSEDGQKLFRDADYMPADPAIPPRDPSLRPDTGKFKAKYFTPDELDAAIPRWAEIYQRLFR